MSSWRRLLLAATSCLVLACPVGARGASETFSGRPVVEVLREFQGRGLTLIYNDQLVPPDLVVGEEPAPPVTGPAGDIGFLGRILAPHGLSLRAAAPGVWSVVPDPGGKAAAVAAGKTGAGSPDTAGRPAGNVPLQEVVVTASRFALAKDDSGSHTFLTQDEVQSLPRLADETLRAIDRLPGAASNGVFGLAHIRGGEEDETEIVLDGMALAEPFHLKNLLSPVSVLDSRTIDSLDIYAGGFPVEYGGRMSAVVEARTIQPPPGGYYELGVSRFHVNGLASGSFDDDRGSWLVSARQSNADEVADATSADLGKPRYFDSSARLQYAFSDDTSGALHLLVSNDQVDTNNSGNTELGEATYRNIYAWATLEHRFSDLLSGVALASFTKVDNHRFGSVDEPGQRTGEVDDHRDYEVGNLKVDFQYGDDRLRYRFGGEISSIEGHYQYDSTYQSEADYPFPGDPARNVTRSVRLQPTGASYGAWASARWRMTGRLTGEVGLRWDDETYTNADSGTELSPRVNLLYDLDPHTQLRASWGMFSQAQGVNELQVEDGVDQFAPPQHAQHAILSVEHTFDDELNLRVEAYYKNYDDLKLRFENLFDPVALLPEFEPNRVAVAPEDGEVRGIEALLGRHGPGPWGWWVSYALSRAEETIGSTDYPRSWDQRNTFNGGVNWAQGPWNVTVAGNWHSGWPTTPATLVLVDDGAGGQVPTVQVGERNSAHLPHFSSVDARASYTFGLSRGELVTFVEVTNFFAHNNACCIRYQVVESPDGSFNLESDTENWPRFVPNLGVLWKF